MHDWIQPTCRGGPSPPWLWVTRRRWRRSAWARAVSRLGNRQAQGIGLAVRVHELRPGDRGSAITPERIQELPHRPVQELGVLVEEKAELAARLAA